MDKIILYDTKSCDSILSFYIGPVSLYILWDCEILSNITNYNIITKIIILREIISNKIN